MLQRAEKRELHIHIHIHIQKLKQSKRQWIDSKLYRWKDILALIRDQKLIANSSNPGNVLLLKRPIQSYKSLGYLCENIW